MPSPTRTPPSRPHGAPAYYLARPATVWLTALHRSRQPSPVPRPPARRPANHP
jgi:hypothetical protein